MNRRVWFDCCENHAKRKMKLAVLNSHRCHILKCILNSDSKASLCTIHNAYTMPVVHFASFHGYIDWKLSGFYEIVAL